MICANCKENVWKISESTKSLEGKKGKNKYSPIASKNGVTDVLVQEFLTLFFEINYLKISQTGTVAMGTTACSFQ